MELSTLGRLLPAAARPLVRRPLVRYRYRGLRPTDAMLVSYPKSGSTWLRFLLANVMTGREADYDSIREQMPAVGRHRDAPTVLHSGGRLLRTHEPLRPYFGLPDQPVIYLVRDGRDVCISYFNHVRRQGYTGDLVMFVEAFLAARVDGYGRWQDHVLSGIEFERTASGPVRLLRYEDLRSDPVPELAKILSFVGMSVGDSTVSEAVEANSRERMRAKQAESAFLRTRPGGGSAYSGDHGEWTELVPSDLRRRFDRLCGPAMAAAGYRTEGGQAPPRRSASG